MGASGWSTDVNLMKRHLLSSSINNFSSTELSNLVAFKVLLSFLFFICFLGLLLLLPEAYLFIFLVLHFFVLLPHPPSCLCFSCSSSIKSISLFTSLNGLTEVVEKWLYTI